MYCDQIFRENCYALSILRAFTLLASSDSDKHKLIRQKVVNKDSPIAIGNYTARDFLTDIESWIER